MFKFRSMLQSSPDMPVTRDVASTFDALCAQASRLAGAVSLATVVVVLGYLLVR